MAAPLPGNGGPRRPRRRGPAIAFMIVWLTFWASAILVAIWHLGGAALSGEPGAMAVLALWVGGAGFGFVSGARHLRTLLLNEPPPLRQPGRRHAWRDGLEPGRADAPSETPPPPPPSDR